MKRMIFLAAMAAAVTVSATGAKTSCTDASANFTITDQPAGSPGLSSDGGGQYINGEAGVIGRINCNGSTLELSGTRHSLLFLGTPLNGGAPSWASSPAPVAFFNIPLGRFFNNAEPNPLPYSETTYFEVTMASPNLGYYFDLENPNATAPLNSPSTAVNTPTMTTLVNVSHSPQVLDQFGNVATPETWVVTPMANPAVGTLLSNLKGGLREVGQFLTTFTITVTRQ